MSLLQGRSSRKDSTRTLQVLHLSKGMEPAMWKQVWRVTRPSSENPFSDKIVRTWNISQKSIIKTWLAYNTTYGLYKLIRQIIIPLTTENKRFSGEIEVDESDFGGRWKGKCGRGAANKIPVFGILERGGKVRVEVVEDVMGDTSLNLILKKVKLGSLVYTDKFRSYDGLVSYGFKHERIDHGLKFCKWEDVYQRHRKILVIYEREVEEISWYWSGEIPSLSKNTGQVLLPERWSLWCCDSPVENMTLGESY